MQYAIKDLARLCVVIAGILLVPTARSQAGPSPALQIGAPPGDCTSVLRLGLQSCTTASGAPDLSQLPPRAAGIGDAIALESRVDAYLANFGKPPRAAVRALLEPSDDNIRAFLADQESTLALAAYVATRMTALKGGEPSAAGRIGAHRFELQAFGQARLRLFQKPEDRSTGPLMHAMAELSQAMPGLEVGVALVGAIDPGQLKREIGRIDPLLSVDVTAPEQVADMALPFLRFDDLSQGSSRDFAALDLSAAQLAQAILAARHAAESATNAVPAGAAP